MNERLGKLVERLHDKTERREIQWQKSLPYAFEASFPNYTIEVGQDSKAIDLITYLKIYNEEGEEIEFVHDYELKSGGLLGIYDDKYQVQLRETYQMARRVALGTEAAIDNLILALED
jgi:hypothetical protein